MDQNRARNHKKVKRPNQPKQSLTKSRNLKTRSLCQTLQRQKKVKLEELAGVDSTESLLSKDKPARIAEKIMVSSQEEAVVVIEVDEDHLEVETEDREVETEDQEVVSVEMTEEVVVNSVVAKTNVAQEEVAEANETTK